MRISASSILWSLGLAHGVTWVVTSYYTLATFSAYTINSFTQDVSVAKLEIVPTQTPLPAPLTVTTTVYKGVTTIQSILPSGAGVPPPRASDKPDFTDSRFVVPITYTQPTSCTYDPQVFVSTVEVDIPFEFLTWTGFSLTGKPIMTRTFTQKCDCGAVDYLPIVTAIAKPEDIDDNYLRSLSESNTPYKLSSCRTPTASTTSTTTSVVSTGGQLNTSRLSTTMGLSGGSKVSTFSELLCFVTVFLSRFLL